MDIEKFKEKFKEDEKKKDIEKNLLLDLIEFMGGKRLANLHRIEMQEDKLRMEIIKKYAVCGDEELNKEKISKIEEVYTKNLKNLQNLKKELED